jgi:hypothetical protein
LPGAPLSSTTISSFTTTGLTVNAQNETISVLSTGTIDTAGDDITYATGDTLQLFYNDGLLETGSFAVVDLAGIDTFINTGTIEGSSASDLVDAVNSTSASTFNNAGLIYNSGASNGVIWGAGDLYNAGTIGGKIFGVSAHLSTRIENDGVIEASSSAAVEFVSDPGTLILDPDSTLSGPYGVEVFGTASNITILLGGTAAAATSLPSVDKVSLGSVGAIGFAGGAQRVLDVTTTELTGTTVEGLLQGNTLDIAGIGTETAVSYHAGALTLTGGSAPVTIALNEPGYVNGDTFALVSDGSGGTALSDNIACFLAGTRIATDKFPVRVEDLKIGDMVQTQHAGLRRVKWVGKRAYAAPFANQPSVLPVCIKANAIADYVPGRDLYVSPGHAICVDGVLVHAGRLVNGMSVTQLESVAAITYYHVELDSHEVIFAENCPVESFRDENFRGQFQNAAEYRALYGVTEPQAPCLERHDSGFLLHAIQVRLLERAGGQVPEIEGPLAGYIDVMQPGVISGWAKTVSWAEMVCGIELPVCLDVFAGEQRVGRVLANLYRKDVKEAGYGTGHHGFEFLVPAGLQGPFTVRRSCDGAALALSETALAA